MAKVLEFQLQHWSFQWIFRADFLWDGLVGSPCRPKDSLLQHLISKASVLQCSAFCIVQLSQPYTTTGKTIALTRRTFVGKVMSLLLNMLSRLVITLLPRSKHLLISWLHHHAIRVRNINWGLLSTYNMPGTIFNSWHESSHLILTAIIWCRCYF